VLFSDKLTACPANGIPQRRNGILELYQSQFHDIQQHRTARVGKQINAMLNRYVIVFCIAAPPSAQAMTHLCNLRVRRCADRC
jgi:hypothetical protein